MPEILCFEDSLSDYDHNLSILKNNIKKINNQIKFYVENSLKEDDVIIDFLNKFKIIKNDIELLNKRTIILKEISTKKSQINLFKEKLELNELNKSYLIRLKDNLTYLLCLKFNYKKNNNNSPEVEKLVIIFNELITLYIGRYYSEDYYRNLSKLKFKENKDSFINFEVEMWEENEEFNIVLEDSYVSGKNSNFSINKKKNKYLIKILIFISLVLNIVLIFVLIFLTKFK